MSRFFSKPAAAPSRSSFILNFLLHKTQFRSMWTGQRYKGYVNYFNTEALFGFVVRDDAPEREYYFHATDLRTESVPRVRPFQQCEFSIHESRGNNYIARDLTSYDGEPLQFMHPNMRLAQDQRTKRLSDLPNGEHERFTGIVISIFPDQTGGLIIPDRLNYQPLHFNNSELQCTGAERLERFSEVEFFARRGRNENARELARCITRRGGQLITAERRERGVVLRRLGAMYTRNDIKANVPPEYRQKRRLGYVLHYDKKVLYGFILPFDSAEETVFVHIDDCHVYGKRGLRRFALVEFNSMRDEETGKTKAMHVTGPDMKVLRYVSENCYLTQDLCSTKLPLSKEANDAVYEGTVVAANPENSFVIIKPSEAGYAPVIAFRSSIKSVSPSRRLTVGDSVEFMVDESAEKEEEEGEGEGKRKHNLQIGYNVTAGGGKPFVLGRNAYGGYLQTKINSPIYEGELEEIEGNDGKIRKGYIVNFSNEYGKGWIEPVNEQVGERYRKVSFSIEDAVLDEKINDWREFVPLQRALVQFEVADLEESELVVGDDGKPPLCTKKAVKVTTQGADVLTMFERKKRAQVNEEEEEGDGG